MRVTDNHQFALTNLPQRNKWQVEGGGIARNVFRLNQRRRFRNVRQLVFIPGAFFAEGQPVVFIITRHQNRECRVGDIHHCLTARITGAAIEVGRVMEDVEFRHRFVIFIHAPQLVDNALNLAVINIARRQREPASLVTAVGFRTNRGIDLFGLTRLKLLDKFVWQHNVLIAFIQRSAIGQREIDNLVDHVGIFGKDLAYIVRNNTGIILPGRRIAMNKLINIRAANFVTQFSQRNGRLIAAH